MDMPIVHGRGANRCPEVAARTRFTERKCAQVLTRRCCGSHLPRTVSLQHSDPRVVHHENHCGGSALLGNSAYNAGGARETECQTAGLAGTERSEKAGGSQGANGLKAAALGATFSEHTPSSGDSYVATAGVIFPHVSAGQPARARERCAFYGPVAAILAPVTPGNSNFQNVSLMPAFAV